jgi:hypothetical protein
VSPSIWAVVRVLSGREDLPWRTRVAEGVLEASRRGWSCEVIAAPVGMALSVKVLRDSDALCGGVAKQMSRGWDVCVCVKSSGRTVCGEGASLLLSWSG